jgi:phosphonate metabolism protein (transferase hexapeptide repeat family)
MKTLGTTPTIGKESTVQDTQLGIYIDIGPFSHISESSLGDYTYCAGFNQIAFAEIGKFCSIATGVRINPGNHPAYTRAAQHHFTYRSRQYGLADEDDEKFFQWRRAQKVVIGNDVWIGHNAVIMPGITIGDGAVVGSGAIVTHDMQPYEIAVGVPARVIKRRYNDETIRGIQSTQWWDWDHDTLRDRLDDFKYVEKFIKLYGQTLPRPEGVADEHS